MTLTDFEEQTLNNILKSKVTTKIVLILLNNNYKSATDLSKESDTILSSISRSLKFLAEKNIIISISTNKNRNNLYKINSALLSENFNNLIVNLATARGIYLD
jgi:predicted transcriptional regulator